MTCVAFSTKFAKTNQKFAENSEFCEKIHYLIVNYSLHSLGVTNAPGVATGVDDVYTAQMLATVLELPTVLALAPLADRFGRKAAMASFS